MKRTFNVFFDVSMANTNVSRESEHVISMIFNHYINKHDSNTNVDNIPSSIRYWSRNAWASGICARTKFDTICDMRLFGIKTTSRHIHDHDLDKIFLLCQMIVDSNYHMFDASPVYLSAIWPPSLTNSVAEWVAYMNRYMEEDYAQDIEEDVIIPKKRATIEMFDGDWVLQNPSRKHQKYMDISELSIVKLKQMYKQY